jgi:hypothetical protein
LDTETTALASYTERVRSRGGSSYFVELFATQETRLERNDTPLRLEYKRSKRKLAFSRNSLLMADEKYVLNTGLASRTRAHDLLEAHPYLRVDNTNQSPEEVALRVVQDFGLDRTPPRGGGVPPVSENPDHGGTGREG